MFHFIRYVPIYNDNFISQIFTLLDQQGSSVIKGNLFVVPINQSILYYQPIYLQGEQNPLPEFKFVVVVYQDRIIMEESLSEALASVFGGDFATEDVEDTEGESALELLEKATKAFEKAQQELQNGNLGLYQNLVEQAQQYVDLALELLNNN